MARIKDFSAAKSADQINRTLDQAIGKKGQQTTADAEEQAERASNLQTQGRKGCKAARINMAFTPENHEYIKLMAGRAGYTMTEYANGIIAKHREEHAEQYEAAKKFRDESI